MKTDKPYVMYVLSHTHWDREWYQPFQGYRRRLVFQIDAMMDLLEKRKGFRCFHLDGQTSVLEDYLEIKPEGRDRLARHIQSGRALVGPWFTMPDEVHLSGESLIRNLQLGHRHCREWGTRPMPIGWVSDVFSHVSQFPQILAGFGLDCAFMHHGTPCLEDERTEMVWEGADGTTILMIKSYPWYGYQDVLQMRYRTRAELQAFERKKIGLATTKVLLGLDGNDHEAAKWDTPEVLARMDTHFAHTRVVHASMPEYLTALRRALGPQWQRGRKRFTGELRVPSRVGNWNGLTNGTGSSRLPLKQANDAQEILLSRLAEPFNAWSVLLGGEPQQPYLDRAWKYLFLNHPHDSICGCSVDQPHRDMVYRFEQARMLAQDSLDDSMQTIADCIVPTARREGEYIVTVFNAGMSASGPVTQFAFEIPAQVAGEKATQGLVPVLLNDAGRPLQVDVVEAEYGVQARPFMYKDGGITPAIWVRRDCPMDRHHVAAATSVPALSYRTWRIAFRRPAVASRGPLRVTVSAARGLLENDSIRLVVRRDGCLDLYDKPTKTWYHGIHTFEDVGDAGDGWNHRHPTQDTVVRSTDAKSRGRVRITKVRQGPLSASLKVSLTLQIPADLVTTTDKGLPPKSRTARSRRRVAMSIDTVFTLDAGSRRVDCHTRIHNRARCHRVRAIFPTNRKTDAWYGDTAFDTVKRPVALRDTTGWNEHDREECPIKNFVAVCDQRAGLAVLTKGLYEAAVQDHASRSIALTLFRGFVEQLASEKTRDSLLLGEVVMEYALLPFAAENGAPPAHLYAEVDRFKIPLMPYSRSASGAPVDETRLPPCDETNPPQPAPSVGTEVVTHSAELKAILKARPRKVRNLPATGGLLDISRPLVLSTIKMAERGNAVIVRVWNPQTRAVKGILQPHFAFKRAARTNLLEVAITRLPARGSAVHFTAGPKAIVTVRFER